DKIRKRRRDNNKIVNMMNTKYSKKRRQIDPVYKITSNIRVLIRNSIKSKGFKKKSKSLSILVCNFEFFKEYLESKFEPWMTWDNYGIFISGEINSGWDIDHIIPISVAKSEDEVIKLN